MWLEQGKGRAGPQQDPDVDAARELSEELAESRAAVASQPEVGREVPARNVDVGAGAFERFRDRWQRRCPVDQHLELVSGARTRLTVGPRAWLGRRIERLLVPKATETASVV